MLVRGREPGAKDPGPRTWTDSLDVPPPSDTGHGTPECKSIGVHREKHTPLCMPVLILDFGYFLTRLLSLDTS